MPGKFSLSQNERDEDSHPLHAAEHLLAGSPTTFAVMRQVALSAGTFAEAVDAVAKATLPASSYFILAGPAKGEGAVVTKRALATEPVSLRRISADAWFVAQTNSDEPRPRGQPEAARLAQVERHLAALGPGLRLEDFWGVMTATDLRGRESPVLNGGTVFTQLMQPLHPEGLRTVVWNRTTAASTILV